MVKKKEALEEEEKIVPSIDFYSLESGEDFDYFPHLADSGFGSDDKYFKQLKQGTYQPHMQLQEYTAKIEKRTKLLRGARPLSQEFTASNHDTWDEYSASEMVPLRDMRKQTRDRLTILAKSFQNTNQPLQPRYYHNNYQYFDHVLLSDAYINSFGGTVIDAYADFIMPKEIKPVLKLRNPSETGDSDAQAKELKKNKEIIETLEQIDRWYSDKGRTSQDPFMDVPLQHKFKTAIINALTFGRDALVYENWKHVDPVSANGIEYRGLPNVVKVMQPIDMGMIEIDSATWKLGGLYVYNTRNYIPSSEMLYLVNQYQSPMIGGMYYGYTKLSRALDPIRLLRRIFAVNYQQFIRNGAMGMGTWVFDSTGYDDTVRKKIRTSLRNSWKSGEFGVIDYANIKDLQFTPMNIDAKIADLKDLESHLFTIISGVMGMPQSLIFDEAAATRATFVGRIISFLNNQIQTPRTTYGAQFATQHYMRIFRTVYAKQNDILEKFYIDVEFEEMELETKTEKVNRLLLEQQLNPYTDEYIGEELNDEAYLEHIDPKKKEEQMMNPPNTNDLKTRGGAFTVEDSSTGQKVNVNES